MRPAKFFEGVKSIVKNVDLIIVRENTEDLYAGIEFDIGTNEAKKLIADINYSKDYDTIERAIKELGKLDAVADKVISTLRMVTENSGWGSNWRDEYRERLRVDATESLSTIATANKKTVPSLAPVFINYLTYNNRNKRRIAVTTLNTISPHH